MRLAFPVAVAAVIAIAAGCAQPEGFERNPSQISGAGGFVDEGTGGSIVVGTGGTVIVGSGGAVVGSGGAIGSGGVVGTGGRTGSGGMAPGSGGRPGSGGAVGTGGRTGSGGRSGTGGALAGSGGTASGGAIGTGGGGAPGTGGAGSGGRAGSGNCAADIVAAGYASGAMSCATCRTPSGNTDPALTMSCQKILDCVAMNWPCGSGSGCLLTCENTAGSDGVARNCTEAIISAGCPAM